MQPEERAYWVALSMASGIGPVRFQRLLEVCGGAEQAWHASDHQLAAAGLERRTAEALRTLRRTLTPEAAMDRLKRFGIQALTLHDPEYPANLQAIADPPAVLFVRGSITPRDAQAVALVGTRQASAYGRAVAEQLGAELAQAGVTVISGLARGIDAAAHRACLDAGGRTLAVLGNGLDQVYPPEHSGLARRLIDAGAGALVSEFAPGAPPDAANFPRRNRIIAGLARATVIVEAGQRSGALITADFALEQGREVLAVPGSILSRLSQGPNSLLRQGATPVTGAADILEALGMPADERVLSAARGVARPLPELPDRELSVWQALGGDPCHVDELARTLRRGAGEVASALIMLELKNLARQVGPMLYTRA